VIEDMRRNSDKEFESTLEAAQPQPRVAAAASPLQTSGSHGRRSLWSLREIALGTTEHSIAIALRFCGELDISALEYALDASMVRQGIFRATFPSRDGEPERNVSRPRDWLEEHDADDLDDAQLTQWLERAAQDASDLVHGPLLRIHLYRRKLGEAVVLVVAHHSVADFWSMTALVRDFETLYSEQTGGQSAPLPELTDFVRHYGWVGGSRVSTYAALSSDASHYFRTVALPSQAASGNRARRAVARRPWCSPPRQCPARADQPGEFLCPGHAGVEQVALEHTW
jgi:condensation domain-containing protein